MKKNCLVKSITVVALATLMMSVFTGCKSKSEESTQSTESAQSTETVAVEKESVEEVTSEDTDIVEEPQENTEEAAEAADENPGSFETDSFSVSYDTEKWYGTIDENSVVYLNCLEAVAGTSYIEISKSDFATPEEAIANIAETKGQDLVEASQFDMRGYNTYMTWNNIPQDAEGVVIDDYYLVLEKDGKVIVVNESITRDSDSGRAEELSYVFDDVIATLEIK